MRRVISSLNLLYCRTCVTNVVLNLGYGGFFALITFMNEGTKPGKATAQNCCKQNLTCCST